MAMGVWEGFPFMISATQALGADKLVNHHHLLTPEVLRRELSRVIYQRSGDHCDIKAIESSESKSVRLEWRDKYLWVHEEYRELSLDDVSALFMKALEENECLK